MSHTAVVIAIDAGTTGIRSRAVFADGTPSVSAYQEFTQYFPKPGWVEHDANEIWQAVHTTLSTVIAQVNAPIAGIGPNFTLRPEPPPPPVPGRRPSCGCRICQPFS